MRDHCSARGQIGTGPVRAALAGPAWALHSIVGWDVQRGLEAAVRLAIERHSQKPHRRPFIEHKKSSGCWNEEGGKVELST